ncbi:MAG: hypothetical protein ACKVJG_11135 [Candidatus Latescibacterota bacterium]|jgi:hypothetical protein
MVGLIDYYSCGINLLDIVRGRRIDLYTTKDGLQRHEHEEIPALRHAIEEAKPLYRRNRAEIETWRDVMREEVCSVVACLFPTARWRSTAHTKTPLARAILKAWSKRLR